MKYSDVGQFETKITVASFRDKVERQYQWFIKTLS